MGNTFTDKAGRKWDLVITLASAPFLRARGLSLSWIEPATAAIADVEAIARMAGESPEKLVTCVAHLVAPTIRERNLAPEEFAAGFDSRALEAAALAFMYARAEWCPGDELRAHMRAALAVIGGGPAPEPPAPKDELTDAIERG